MTTSNSMNNYIQKTVKHYSSLFTLPSHTRIIWLLLIFSLLSGTLVSYALHPPVDFYFMLPLGLALGATLFVLIIVTDFMVHSVCLRRDLVFNLRRCSALSLYSLLVWFSFILLGTIANIFNHMFWLRLFLLGFCVVLLFAC